VGWPSQLTGKEGITMNNSNVQPDSQGWLVQVWISFGLSVSFTLIGIYNAPVDFWVKGFLAMGFLFTVGSTFTLAKTMRDRFEAGKFINRVASAKTEKILHEYELRDPSLGA
jgi:hypothetical protein